jgi:hypothetical protein
MKIALFILALFLATEAHAANPSRLVETGHCAATGAELVRRLQSEVDVIRKSEKKGFEKKVAKWLNSERKSGKDESTLNWFRAIDPWVLPETFPSKTAFERCAGELGTYAETPTKEALAAWSSCLDLTYAEEKPTEFTALAKCLSLSSNH